MGSLKEMHSYSIKDQFYEYLEYAPFKDIKETESYIEKLNEIYRRLLADIRK